MSTDEPYTDDNGDLTPAGMAYAKRAKARIQASRDPGERPRRAYFCTEDAVTDDGGFIACLATENVAGYQVLSGNGAHAKPWVWGTNMLDAQRVCDEQNRADFNLTPEEATAIINSSKADQFANDPDDTEGE